MAYANTAEWWASHCHMSGEELARVLGGDGGNWRRRLRKARQEHDHLDWRTDVRADMPAEPSKPICGLFVFDLHHPHQVKKLWANILRYTFDLQPDVFGFGGDQMNMDALDHWAHEKNQRRKLEGQRLKKEYDGFNRDVLNPLSTILPEDCRKIFLLGNHEKWVEQYIESHPEVEGFFEIENNLNLEGWEVYDYGLTANVGKLYFHHGEYVLKHNAARTVEVFQRNMVYGHGHTYQAHTNIAPLDSDAHMATQIPCACSLNPHYRLNKPNGWLNGFCVFYVQPDGSFNLFPVIAIDGCFTAPNGVRYE